MLSRANKWKTIPIFSAESPSDTPENSTGSLFPGSVRLAGFIQVDLVAWEIRENVKDHFNDRFCISNRKNSDLKFCF